MQEKCLEVLTVPSPSHETRGHGFILARRGGAVLLVLISPPESPCKHKGCVLPTDTSHGREAAELRDVPR